MSPDLGALYAVARRCSTSGEEAEDLVQEALLVALEAGQGLDRGAWLAGVVRRLGAFSARTAGRRRAREAAFAERWGAEEPAAGEVPDPAGLSPALARVARLVAGGCTREELVHLLRIREEALRQRLTALRRVVRPTSPPSPLAVAPGLARQALRAHPGLARSVLGAHDPDGHLFFVGVLTKGAPPATEVHIPRRLPCSRPVDSPPCSSSFTTSNGPSAFIETPSAWTSSGSRSKGAPTG